MSRALELAEKCGFAISRGGNGYWDNKAQLESFYHAARAEALKDAIVEWMLPYKAGQQTFITRLRAMADREVK